MKIAIDVAGFSAAESDGFRRAMGTWRSSKEMEKLHKRFVDGCIERNGLTHRTGGGALPPGRGLRQLRLQQEPRRGLRTHRVRERLPEALLPGPVRDRADQRPADGLLPGRGAHQRCEAPRRRVSCRSTSTRAASGRRPSGSACPTSHCRTMRASTTGRRSSTRRPASCPTEQARDRWAAPTAEGYGIRLGLQPGQGHRRGGRGGARRRGRRAAARSRRSRISSRARSWPRRSSSG